MKHSQTVGPLYKSVYLFWSQPIDPFLYIFVLLGIYLSIYMSFFVLLYNLHNEIPELRALFWGACATQPPTRWAGTGLCLIEAKYMHS